jgi:Tol biopolymer transport system component
LMACVAALLAVSEKAEATFAGKPGKIAYSGAGATDGEIYTIKPGGGGRFNVTGNTTDDRDPSYSPNGKKIAYSGKDGPKGDFEIYTIKAGSGGRFNVTDDTTDDFEPSWGSRHDDDDNDDNHNDDDEDDHNDDDK